MKQKPYIREFDSEAHAMDLMRSKNWATRSAPPSHRELFAVVPGPRDNFAVVDLRTAIDLGIGYKWEE